LIGGICIGQLFVLLLQLLHFEDDAVDHNQYGLPTIHHFIIDFKGLTGFVIHTPHKDNAMGDVHVTTLAVFIAADKRALLTVFLHAHHGYFCAAGETA
jgi:hypothetical protein